MGLSLPPFAPFPSSAWKDKLIPPTEWTACLEAWVSLAEAHLSLPDTEFASKSLKDESLPAFLSTFVREVASSTSASLGSTPLAETLTKLCWILTARCLQSASTPGSLLQWEFLSHLARVYGKKRTSGLLMSLSPRSNETVEHSLAGLKKFLIKNLDEGLHGDLPSLEDRLNTVNYLLNASPQAASFLLAGSDFLDGLIGCYRIMNPPLRKTIITTGYLCLLGLTEGDSPKLSMLNDQLYSLKAAADAHKAGPLNANDSLAAELVSATPLLQQVQHRLEVSGSLTNRMKTVLKDLQAYKKPGVSMKPSRQVKRKVDKGKGVAVDHPGDAEHQIHIHRMSRISQVQDLFPELGSGFVSKLLDEYKEDTEQVIAHLLEGSLPPHLENVDRSEELYVNSCIRGTGYR